MSAASARRLKRLEAEMTPDASWTTHLIWSHTQAGFEEQKPAMLADGRATAADLFLWDILKEGEPLRQPQTETNTKPWIELLDEMAEEDRRREMA